MSSSTRTAHDFVSGETPSAAVFDGLPGGLIGQDGLDADTSAISTTETAFHDVTPTVNASRKLVARLTTSIVFTVADDQFGLYFRQNGTLVKRFLVVAAKTGSAGEHHYTFEFAFNAASGTPTYTVGLLRTSGTGTGTVQSGSQLTLTDVGPST